MKRASYLQEVRTMRFQQSYEAWQSGRLTQGQAAEILGVCERSFRRYIRSYEGTDGGCGGLEALDDKRLSQPSRRRAPLEEGIALANMYRAEFADFNVRHFHEKYAARTGAAARSYSWVKGRAARPATGQTPQSQRQAPHQTRTQADGGHDDPSRRQHAPLDLR